MTPAQFLGRVKRGEIPSMCLFLGKEGYHRKKCREALTTASAAAPETFDASETSLAAILDDARAMSLFASERLMFVVNAESALPRSNRSAAATEDDEDGVAGP